jgi:short-subunit dehydrogenase
MGKFENKTVFITGASAGIGAALAKEFAQQGANLVLTARRRERLQALASELTQNGRRAMPLACDVTKESDLTASVLASVKEFGKINVVVANAGFSVAGALEKMKLEDYQRQFDTNIYGVLRTVYATLEELKKTRGTLVLIGSVSGYIALPGVSAYSMSKFAVHALARALRTELKPYGIAVVLIAPGFVTSEIRQVDNQGAYQSHAQDPIPTWARMPTEKAARIIVRAIAKRKAEEIITFHGKLSVFLQRHFPGLISSLVKMGVRGRAEVK